MLSLPAEVGRHFTPFGSLPFQNRRIDVMSFEPFLGTGNQLEKIICLCIMLQFRFALFLLYPQQRVMTVRIDGFSDSLLLHERCSMHNGKKLADIICPVQWTEMKHHLPCSEINAAIFHWSRIAAACGIHSPGISCNFLWERKYSIVSVFGRRLQLVFTHCHSQDVC